ncbi:class F sortase [Nocardia sp. NPDC057440]|uniref:class F sortase n=1 Tax=Nocardia sp. NPDC057440 TaxID=3346134 RepID=UPI003672958C
MCRGVPMRSPFCAIPVIPGLPGGPGPPIPESPPQDPGRSGGPGGGQGGADTPETAPPVTPGPGLPPKGPPGTGEGGTADSPHPVDDLGCAGGRTQPPARADHSPTSGTDRSTAGTGMTEARARTPRSTGRSSPVSSKHLRLAASILLFLAALSPIARLCLGGNLVPATDAAVTAFGSVAPAALPESLPVELHIPAIAVDGPLSELGLNPDRTVELPTDFQVAGWYRNGPPPGDMGSAVILGHVDSYTGPAVFYRLSSLRPGDQVDVTRADRSVAHFLVQEVATYLKSEFPTHEVYDSRGYSALQLVTCGGEFDHTIRSYLSNVVAYTVLVGITPQPAGTPWP